MGLIIAKFRKTKSNSDLLESIDKEINAIESFQRSTEYQRKKIIGQFLVFSVGIYLLSATLIYFYCYPNNFKERLLYLIPFILAPTFIILMKKLITMYYNRIWRKNDTKLVNLRTEKKRILENIMETETYKKAKSILEKYAPETIQKSHISSTPIVKPSLQSSVLRQRIPANRSVALPAIPSSSPPSLSRTYFATPHRMVSADPRSSNVGERGHKLSAPLIPLPRTILPKDRSIMDKMIEYLVGDGPNNRYALICKECSGHNGMALIDEFEYISFKCCYCFALNPSRKKRPAAPQLNLKGQFLTPADSSDSERQSESELEKDSAKQTASIAEKSEGGEGSQQLQQHQQQQQGKSEKENMNLEKNQSENTENLQENNDKVPIVNSET